MICYWTMSLLQQRLLTYAGIYRRWGAIFTRNWVSMGFVITSTTFIHYWVFLHPSSATMRSSYLSRSSARAAHLTKMDFSRLHLCECRHVFWKFLLQVRVPPPASHCSLGHLLCHLEGVAVPPVKNRYRLELAESERLRLRNIFKHL